MDYYNKNHKKVVIKDMTDKHLINGINFFTKRKEYFEQLNYEISGMDMDDMPICGIFCDTKHLEDILSSLKKSLRERGIRK